VLFCRYGLIVAIFACIGLVLGSADWQPVLQRGNSSWLLNSVNAPIWAPPPPPPDNAFGSAFSEVPHATGPAFTVSVELLWEWTAVRLFAWLWGVFTAFGLAYLAVRKDRRDLSLELAVWAAVGITASASICLLLWTAFGGWGPPVPWLFGLVGMLAGGFFGLLRHLR
jgi:hypothetical protein